MNTATATATAEQDNEPRRLRALRRRESWSSPLPKKTLKELGANLPIGLITPDKKLIKPFSLRPMRWKEEKEIQKLKNKPGMNQGKFVTGLLSVLLEHVHGVALEGMKEAERALLIGAMFMPDVLYIYFYARVMSLGPIMELDIPCGRCNGLKFEFDGDLSGLDVRVAETPEHVTSSVTLDHGFPYREGMRKQLTIRPIPWSVLESHDLNDEGQMKTAVFQRSIVGIDGIAGDQMAVVPESALDELVKLDVEKLTNHIERFTPGPQPIVKADCPRCQTEWFFPIRWAYDSFFTSSSQ